MSRGWNMAEFRKIAPAAVTGLRALTAAVTESSLDAGFVELVKIRVSQINGCAYCLQYHLIEARKLGVAASKLDLVAVWRDAGIFSAKEKAGLAWAEALTHISPDGAPEEAYQAVRAEFGESETVFLTVAIATINAWNRIGVGLQLPPPVPAA